MSSKSTKCEEWKVFHGTICHSTECSPMEILSRSVIGIKGKEIMFLGPESNMNCYKDKYGFETDDIFKMKRGQFVMPGMIDTHIHSCQYSYCGTGFDKPLLEWLEAYTYPVESKFSDVQFAETVHEALVPKLLRNGTTTAQYFASIHKEASLNLCQVTQKYGQRAFVGKISMDNNLLDNGKEHYYNESTSEALSEAEKFVVAVQEMKDDRLAPVVTPRFVLTSTPMLLTELSKIAKKYDARIQSHMSENVDEVAAVRKMFPDQKSYAEVCERHGLLSNKTVMAHIIHVSDDELEILARTGTKVAHCPSSNYNLGSGLCNVQRLMRNNITVSFGTDVAGGHCYSILSQIREGFTTAMALSYQETGFQTQKSLTYPQLFSMSTLGGAKSLGIDDKTGNFEVGKEFDAALVNIASKFSSIDMFSSDDDKDIILKYLSSGDDRNVEEVYVAGNKLCL